MYKVFINDKPLIFCSSKLKLPDLNTQEFYVFENENEQKIVFASMSQSTDLTHHVILSNTPEYTFNNFFKDFKKIKAAGGLVQNQKNEILLIYRNACWDLPKGKVEEGESIRIAAIREVEEECGLKGPVIRSELISSYHTYEINKKKYLKHTQWFAMSYDKEHLLIPQTEEGIVKVEWVKTNNIDLYLNNTFQSIKWVVDQYLTY